MPEENNLHSLTSVPLREIVKQEYHTYQIYTLMDRAIPYLQDGLKPGQRRILFTLWKNQNKGLIKVSAATGLVLTLHPHGPASIESTIVNMAQDYTFANNYPLIDKKGYFGERMETTPAAGRYIECKLGKVATYLLFDDVNQLEMIPNYDESAQEPAALLPKLPLMLLNGAEGIGTGFSSVIPSFHHNSICQSMIAYIKTGKAKKLNPYVNGLKSKIQKEKGKYIFPMLFEEKQGKIYITDLPRTYDATKCYRLLNKWIEKDIIKDYIDSSVDNDIMIELIFKKGHRRSLEEIQNTLHTATSLTPNYTLISEQGVRIFKNPEDIIELFTKQRLVVVKRRYELFCEELEKKIRQSNEIIKFIKNKEYNVATRSANRKSFVDYLAKKKYTYADYLVDMPIYRMTKEEVQKRQVMLKEDRANLREYTKIAKSPAQVKKKLIEELEDVDQFLGDWLFEREKEKAALYKKLHSKPRKRSKRTK